MSSWHQRSLVFGLFLILFFFPGRGKKGSIVPPHTSEEQQTGWLLCFLVGLLTNRNRNNQSFDDWWLCLSGGGLMRQSAAFSKPTPAAGSVPRSMWPWQSFSQYSTNTMVQTWCPHSQTHLYTRRPPPQVFQWSGCKAARYSRWPLLHHHDDASRLRPQLLHQVFQLPAHLDQSQSRNQSSTLHWKITWRSSWHMTRKDMQMWAPQVHLNSYLYSATFLCQKFLKLKSEYLLPMVYGTVQPTKSTTRPTHPAGMAADTGKEGNPSLDTLMLVIWIFPKKLNSFFKDWTCDSPLSVCWPERLHLQHESSGFYLQETESRKKDSILKDWSNTTWIGTHHTNTLTCLLSNVYCFHQ